MTLCWRQLHNSSVNSECLPFTPSLLRLKWWMNIKAMIKDEHDCVIDTRSVAVLTPGPENLRHALWQSLLTWMKEANQRAGGQELCLSYCSVLLAPSCIFPLLFPVPNNKIMRILCCTVCSDWGPLWCGRRSKVKTNLSILCRCKQFQAAVMKLSQDHEHKLWQL